MLKNVRAIYHVLHDIKLSEIRRERLVSKRLESVLVASYKHVPYYKKIMQDIGYNPLKDYCGLKDLARFPIITKKDLKASKESLFLKENVDTSKIYNDSTSGSTGIPLNVYRDWNERAFQLAKFLRFLILNGYSLKDKTLSVSSPSRLSVNKTVLQKFGLMRRLAVSYLLPIPQIVDILLDYNPQVLHGNRSHIDLIAIELLKRGIRSNDLKLIVVGAEMIHENSRNLYKQAFGLDAIECYGSTEMGIMAYEIQGTQGLYLNNDLTYFEFLNKNGNPVAEGEPGRIVVTDLLAKTMPFIRYDQGDYAIIKKFIGNNGKSEDRIIKIIGREEDRIILQDGSIKPCEVFYVIMKKFQGIMQFRVIQKTKNHFQLKIATNPGYFTETYNQIINALYSNFPNSCTFELLRGDNIEPDPNGKLRMLISEL